MTKKNLIAENNENNNVIFVSIFNQSNDTNEKYQLAFPTECNPTHAIVPINLLNNGNTIELSKFSVMYDVLEIYLIIHLNFR